MKNVKKTWVVLALLGCMQVLHAQTVYLHSDNPQMKWKLKPQAEVGTDVKSLCGNGYNVSAWVDAVVPGTAFNSYVIAGLEKDPNFGDNIHQVNRDKYDCSFWYRTTFRVPADFTKELIWLNFNGVNRRAEVYLNGTLLGKLDGFMHRGHFNVTSIVNRDKENVLAVLVHMPDTPLANQGSPTYLSSGGWDWMPYVPGLNSGITDKVFLTNTGTATLIDPWIRTNLPTRARADLSVALDVKNNSVEKTKVLVRGTITPGNIVFQKELDVNAHTTEQVKFDKRYFPQLCIDQPRLWWPNGYGEPNLYHCKFEVMVDGRVSETKDVSFGIKKYSYDKEGNTFHIYINDIPVFVKGANWGMSEYMLRCRGEEYDTKVRLHKEMNFNMIRNWLGSVTDDEFYEACDKYGIMVWDDFWINSNPNLPYDLNVFNNNMMEKIKRVRNHPSIAVWCGDNESNPQPPLEGWMAENIRTFDGGDRYFQANSHAQGLTGSGPWGAFEPRFYFTKYPDGLEGDPARGWGFRTEIGTAVVPTFESFKKFMPKENWWPRDEMWNKHYFGQNAFNAAPDRYDASITKGFGKPEGIEDYCRKAQLVNIESNKAMYEGWLDRMWEDASGIMTWMGQSAYPSMVWQTSYKLVNMNSEQHTTAKVWLITGASRGMGHAIMEAALAAGHCVAAVSRSGEITTHIEDGAAQLLPYALDVTNTEQAVFDRMAEAVVKRFGRIDVLVNNAGHGQFTYFEESDEQQIRDVFETNLFGLMRVTRAVLPVMRRQHAGHIFNISSAAGYSGVGPSIYHTSKFAVTGFSESLAFETEQFGIRVTIVAPGLFRTDFMNFNSAYHLPARPIADYDAFRERMSGFVKYMNGREPGNPEVLGRLVVKAADSENPPLHLPVGADAIETLETHHEAQRKDVEAWREVSCATAFPPEESEVDTQAFFQ